jgi:polyhydroxyalkanoate synthesis regulator phasin
MDIVKEVMDLGLGVLALSREKAEKVAKDLAKKGKITRKESQVLINEFIKKGKIEEKNLEKTLSRLISGTFSKIDFATKDDIRRLESQIRKIKTHKR